MCQIKRCPLDYELIALHQLTLFCNVLISVYPLPCQASCTLTLQSQLLSIQGCLISYPAEEREPKTH